MVDTSIADQIRARARRVRQDELIRKVDLDDLAGLSSQITATPGGGALPEKEAERIMGKLTELKEAKAKVIAAEGGELELGEGPKYMSKTSCKKRVECLERVSLQCPKLPYALQLHWDGENWPTANCGPKRINLRPAPSSFPRSILSSPRWACTTKSRFAFKQNSAITISSN